MEYRNINDYEVLYLISENNEDAYQYMFYKYTPFAKKYASMLYKKFKGAGIEYDDLFQEGMFGLSEALKKYDFREDNMFFTFATLCIKREMERVVIKALRNKHFLLNTAFSFDDEVSDTGLLLKEILFNETDNTDTYFFDIGNAKYVLDLKYHLKDKYAPVYELKINGFSNQEISTLLELKYKDVDNYLRSIKLTLKKIINNNIE